MKKQIHKERLTKKTNKKERKSKEAESNEVEIQYEIDAFKNALGENNVDDEEIELEKRVFGGEGTLELDHGEEFEEDEVPKSSVKSVRKRKPAWVDADDEEILVQNKSVGLTNCHRSMTVRNDESYKKFAEEKFVKAMGMPQWAEDWEKNTEDESILQKTGNYIQALKSLPQGVIDVQRCSSLADSNSKKSHINAVEFHPTSKVSLVATSNGTITLYQIDGETNAKIQSVHFERFPINTAHFTLDGNEIIAGSQYFSYYYNYDMISGKMQKLYLEKRLEQANVKRFLLSPDGKYLAIYGSYGSIHLLATRSKEWIGSLKMNGAVTALTFNSDGSTMYSHGDAGEIYVWDMKTRSCIQRFVDQGCLHGLSLALSPNHQYLATGSDMGVVNVYDASSCIRSKNPEPLKALMNLTTAVTQLKFNSTSELLAMSSPHKANAVKLVHFPSISVFSNFPMKDVFHPSSIDISLNSGYMGIGNNRGNVYLYRLKHYKNF